MCSQVTCKALIGAPLSDNEFLKIEQTHLADIIAAEEGSSHLRTKDISDDLAQVCHHSLSFSS